MVNLSKVLKVKVPPVAILVSGLLVVSLITALGGILDYNSQLNNSHLTDAEIVEQQIAELDKDNRPASNKNSKAQNSSDSYQDGGDRENSDSYTNSSSPLTRPSSSSSGSSHPDSKISYVKVFLSVNGVPKGGVALKSTSNQCDVLRQAYANGQISSLNIRRFSDTSYYAVYEIDGIGDPQSVWWKYTVNGTLPPRACNDWPVHNGDSINWQYLKN